MSRGAIPSTVDKWVYRCAPDFVWVRDAERVIVVDSEGGRSWSLDGIEAAIWDWLAMGYSYPKIVGFVSLILKRSQDETGAVLQDTLRRWYRAGLVQWEGEA